MAGYLCAAHSIKTRPVIPTKAPDTKLPKDYEYCPGPHGGISLLVAVALNREISQKTDKCLNTTRRCAPPLRYTAPIAVKNPCAAQAKPVQQFYGSTVQHSSGIMPAEHTPLSHIPLIFYIKQRKIVPNPRLH